MKNPKEKDLARKNSELYDCVYPRLLKITFFFLFHSDQNSSLQILRACIISTPTPPLFHFLHTDMKRIEIGKRKKREKEKKKKKEKKLPDKQISPSTSAGHQLV
ncbi:hypothetical protein CEXT_644491 [Caerostris extrusa]|uniref:Uncharacterized protein n=1 Tax=Caerostris extrusa TaxID=172846 RepID=A0AAV4XGS5_CAEEX|nr:hypothetical protein CEXT_644491 [Caerostris extrusa]